MPDYSDIFSDNFSDRSVVSMDNRALADAWLKWLRETRGRSALTVMQYRGKAYGLIEFLDDTPLGQADIRQLEQWLGRPRQSADRRGKPATLSRDATVIKGFYRFLFERGLIRNNPSLLLVAPTVRNENPRAIDDDVWRELWFRDDLADDERVMLGLGYFCGLRRMEMVGLRRSDLHPKTGLMDVRGKGGIEGVVPYVSTARVFGERAPHLIGKPTMFLGPLAKMKGDLVLPWSRWAKKTETMTPDQVSRRLERLLERVGMAEAFTPHALRHSFVTKLLNPCGIPLEVVSRLARHRGVGVTMRYVRTATDPLAEYLK